MLPPYTIFRYFNDYLQAEALRTKDVQLDMAVYEALGHAGYTGHLSERAKKAVQAEALPDMGYYLNITQIVSYDVLGGSGGASSEPLLIIPYGDSFVQRGMDILGSPNSLDSGNVDPQLLKWPTDLTTRRGGVQWGFTSVIQDHSAGRYVFDQNSFWGIGGFNTGFLSRVDTTEPFYLTLFLAFLDGLISGGYDPKGVLLFAGVNNFLPTASGGSIKSAAGTYADLLSICAPITDRDIPVFVGTIPPRGHASDTAARAETPQDVLDCNALLNADLEDEPSVNGLVRVVDVWPLLHDVAGQSNDVLPAKVYDGLHPSKEGCVDIGTAFVSVMDSYFSGVTVDPSLDTTNYLPNADFATATGGTHTRNGNDTTNVGFTATGTVPASWTIRTCGSSHGLGLTNWNGTDPNNIKGTNTYSGEGGAITVTLDCDSSTTTNANSRAVRVEAEVTLPSTDELPVGAYYEGLVDVDVSTHAGLRGVSVAISATEPDLTERWVHSDIAAPNGTANMDIPGSVDLTNLRLRTPPIIRKEGTYGTVLFCVYIYVAGDVADVSGTVTITNPQVRRAKYLDGTL